MLWSINTFHFDNPTVFANVLSRMGMEAAAMRAISLSLDWRHFFLRSKENRWQTVLNWRTVLAAPCIGVLCHLKTLEIELTNDRGLPMSRLVLSSPKNHLARWGCAHVFDLIDGLSKLPLESVCVYVPSIEDSAPNPWFHSASWLAVYTGIADRPTRDAVERMTIKLMSGDHISARE